MGKDPYESLYCIAEPLCRYGMIEKQCFVNALSKLNLTSLRQIGAACGSPRTGRKAVIIEKMYDMSIDRMVSATKPLRIVSLDLGIKNIGVCQLLIPPLSTTLCTAHTTGSLSSEPKARQAITEPSPRFRGRPLIERSYRTTISENIEFRFPEFSTQTIEFIKTLIPNNGLDDAIDAVIVERQRPRTARSVIPNEVFRVNVAEGMVFTALGLLCPNVYLESVMPKYVIEFWKPKSDNDDTKRSYAMAKKDRKILIEKWKQLDLLNYDKLKMHTPKTPALVSTKADDINDSLVQAITWMQWRANLAQLLTNVENGEPDLTANLVVHSV